MMPDGIAGLSGFFHEALYGIEWARTMTPAHLTD